MKKLLALVLIAGIPAATSLLSVINPALAAAPQTVTAETSVSFPTHAFFGQTRLCARTNAGTGRIGLEAGSQREIMAVTTQERCISRRWGGLRVFVTHGGGSADQIIVFTS